MCLKYRKPFARCTFQHLLQAADTVVQDHVHFLLFFIIQNIMQPHHITMIELFHQLNLPATNNQLTIVDWTHLLAEVT